MSDWQSCLATVSVPPERGRELSAVSTEQRRQILIFYLSIIFVFHGKGKWARQVCVCMWVSVCSYLVHVFICRVVVYILSISLRLGKCDHTQCMYTVASTLLSFKVDYWPMNTAVYLLLTPITNWMETGRWKKTCLCVSVCCVCFAVNQCFCVFKI